MGLLDWLFRRKRPQAPTVSKQIHVDIRPTSGHAAFPRDSASRARFVADARWIAPGQQATVQHYTLPGGMVYVGTGLRSHDGYGVDPCLIDPSLSVRKGPGEPLGYHPSYSSLTPANREAYLSWLAAGRHTDVGEEIGFVFLFFYGLERRVLVDLMPQPRTDAIRAELLKIRDEVHRLLQLYGPTSGSFNGYASRFREALDALIHTGHGTSSLDVPPLSKERWNPPLTLRLAIGTLAREGTPIPPDWALAWAWYFPETRLRTPATRCTPELRRLFHIRYRERFGEGLRPNPGKGLIRESYHPANGRMREVAIDTGSIPNTFELKTPARKLVALLDEVQTELDPYSRWRGRNPDAVDSLEHAAQLPSPLVTTDSPPVATLKAWLDNVITDPTGTVVPGRDLLSRWSSPAPEKLPKAASGALAGVLEQLNIGIEPDARIGGASISAEQPVVLFRLDEPGPQSLSAAYENATTLVHITTAVSAADGHVSADELDELSRQADRHLHLSQAERARLHAHVVWLASIDIRLTGMKKRLAGLNEDQKRSIADIVTMVASVDGVASPREVATIRRVYTLLGLDANKVASHLHGAMTAPSAPPANTSLRRTTPDRQTTGAASLDRDAIARKQAEAAAVSTLLASIFNDDEDEITEAGTSVEPAAIESSDPPGGADFPADDVLIDRLDAAHSRLVRALIVQQQWDQAEYDDLAASFGLMPAGALDVINEYALDTWDEPLIEMDDALVINDYVRKELPV